MLLDPGAGWSLAKRVDEVLPNLSPQLDPRVSAETQSSVIELATTPHVTADSAAGEAQALRSRLALELAPMGLRAACAGTHPAAVWDEITISAGPRHQAVYASMRELARREPTLGLHVHVGVKDPESAIVLYNRLRVLLPLLLAVSANSPFWQGRDTGLASTRTPLFQAFPRVGIPRTFDSYDHYVETVDRLIRSGAFPEPTFLWWDVRPQPRFGTVEVRVMDVQADAASTRALVALVQSVAYLELEEGYHTSDLWGEAEFLVENRFIASRDGMQARLIDPDTEERVPARTQIAKLIEAARPYAERLGCSDALESVMDLARENGAARQRKVLAQCGTMSALVQHLSDQFVASDPA